MASASFGVIRPAQRRMASIVRGRFPSTPNSSLGALTLLSTARYCENPSKEARRTICSQLRQSGSSQALTLNTARVTPGARRCLSTTGFLSKGILPETDNPLPKESSETPTTATAAEITNDEYHELSDEYMDLIVSKFEEVAEEREDVDVEFSSGVITVAYQDGTGTYVINKQPPNKQIWLSSPKSGPKRYDWVILGDGQNDKEGTGQGDWIYLRDGTSLASLLRDELDVDIVRDIGQRAE